MRIAPSPTGFAHIGLARTALFNYLFSKKNNGSFVLRIEDTDKERSKKEYEDRILANLQWLGIQWDEGPDVGGEYGPYRQGERGAIYREYLEKLQSKDRVYTCYCTKEELEQEKQEQQLAKLPPRYGGRCRKLSAELRASFDTQGKESTIRFRLEPQTIIIDDLIRGRVTFDTALMDDFIIAKDFDTPLYNFAVVIDDALMQISHVIRGEEHISNTPKQIQLAQALDLPIPAFGHLPLILDSDRKKMSKRENKTSLDEYIKDGYLPEALINFMALLGWNPGNDQELFSLADLEKVFDTQNINKSGSIFDIQKLDWFNSHYIRERSIASLSDLAIPYLIEEKLIQFCDSAYTTADGSLISHRDIEHIISIERTRMKKISDIAVDTSFYFTDPLNYNADLLQWKQLSHREIHDKLAFSLEIMREIPSDSWTSQSIQDSLKNAIVIAGLSNGEVLWPLRVSLSGLGASPSPFDIAWIIGKEATLRRIAYAQQILGE